MIDALKILGVTVTNEKKNKILEYLFDRLKKTGEKTFIITPNPEMLVYASKHLDYKSKLNSSTISLPDGIGLFFASAFMGRSLKERIPGVDFIEELCIACEDNPLSMGFLGAKAGVAERASKRLLEKYPYLNIVFAGEEWNDKSIKYKVSGSKYNKKNKKKILNTQIDILFVAFGVPKQEEWIYEHLDSLPVKAAMGVGGALDFFSGTIPRAPFILRYVGLEWFFRLVIQPWRWKRQLSLIEFISLVFKEKFSGV